jgi:translation initiation factor IF-3
VRLLNYGRYKYEQQKKERASRKASRPAELKEIRFSPKIDDGDLAVRIRQTHGFLADGHKVKVSVRHRGREQSHPEIARALLARVIEGTASVGTVERAPLMEGRYLFMILGPARAARGA